LEKGVFEWEKLQVCQFFEVVQGSSSVLSSDDSWIWQVGESLEFSINSAYGLLRVRVKGKARVCSKNFWGSRFYPRPMLLFGRCWKTILFLKLIWLGTKLWLFFTIYFCRLKEESTNHLFFWCRFYWIVWNLYFAWLGLMSVAPKILTHISYNSTFVMLKKLLI